MQIFFSVFLNNFPRAHYEAWSSSFTYPGSLKVCILDSVNAENEMPCRISAAVSHLPAVLAICYWLTTRKKLWLPPGAGSVSVVLVKGAP